VASTAFDKTPKPTITPLPINDAANLLPHRHDVNPARSRSGYPAQSRRYARPSDAPVRARGARGAGVTHPSQEPDRLTLRIPHRTGGR